MPRPLAPLGSSRCGLACLIVGRSGPAAMPASKRDVEIARSLLGSEGNITSHIIRLNFSVENTTKSEINAMCGGRPTAGGRLRAACRALLRKR